MSNPGNRKAVDRIQIDIDINNFHDSGGMPHLNIEFPDDIARWVEEFSGYSISEEYFFLRVDSLGDGCHPSLEIRNINMDEYISIKFNSNQLDKLIRALVLLRNLGNVSK